MLLLIPHLAIAIPAAAQQQAPSRTEQRVLNASGRDEVVFHVPAGRLLEVRALSDEFDAVLELTPPAGGDVLRNDDDGMSTNSRVTAVTSEAGEWTAAVSAYQYGSGPYELRVSIVEPLGVEVIDGRFGADDLSSPKGERYRAHQFALDSPSDLLIQVASGGEVGELLAMSPNGQRHAPGYAQLGGTPQLRLSDAEAGTWQLFVVAAGSETGAYRLQIARIPGAGPAEQQTGHLTAADSVLLRGEHFDRYFIDVTDESMVEFEVTSAEFDTFLAVLPPSGTWVQDDDGIDRGSRVELPGEPGRWEVVVTSFAPGETGEYRLDIPRRGFRRQRDGQHPLRVDFLSRWLWNPLCGPILSDCFRTPPRCHRPSMGVPPGRRASLAAPKPQTSEGFGCPPDSSCPPGIPIPEPCGSPPRRRKAR